MKWIFLACSLVMMWLDYRATNRSVPADKQKLLRRTIATLWTLDLMTFIYGGFTYIFWSDNPTWMVISGMWLSFAYMTLVIARGPLMLAMAFTQSTLLRILGVVIWVYLAALFIFSARVTRTDYLVNMVTINSSSLPKAFDGYRILQLSDIHIGSLVDPETELATIVDICNDQQADMIDIRHSELKPSITKHLQRLQATDGVFSVTGNRDRGVGIRDTLTITTAYTTSSVIATQRSMGWQVLDNCSTHIRRGDDSISVTGISFSHILQEKRHSSRLPSIDIADAHSNISKEEFNITLSHIPQLWDTILDSYDADLTLSGHVHAMQMKFPIGERGLSPSRLLYKRWSGLYEEQERWLYINDGIGGSMYPMRIGSNPEITVIELRCK